MNVARLDHMDWYEAAAEQRWAISSFTFFSDMVVVSVVRWCDRGKEQGKYHTIAVGSADGDTMLQAFKTMLRMEGV